MDTLSRYWRLVRLNSAGHCQIQTIPSVKNWVAPTLADLIAAQSNPDVDLQKQLLEIWQAKQPHWLFAQLSLRCFITHQIRAVCYQLVNRFGETYGFGAPDLFPLVLDDEGQIEPKHRPFTLEILATYDAHRASLSTWANRLTHNHPDLSQALLERGLYRVSDWAILNDTRADQVQRILRDYHRCSEYEVRQAVELLNQYHQVCLRDRIQQRRAGRKGRCQPPTPEQLQQMNAQTSPKMLLAQLKTLAVQLRQYRIHARGGNPMPYQSEETDWENIADPRGGDAVESEDDQTKFLAAYRQALAGCLEEAIAAVIQANIAKLKKRQPPKDGAYLQGLHLFHCLGVSMGKAAPALGLTSQVQVNRLLQLKRLRADVRHQLIPQLQQTIRHQALAYVSADRLRQIDQTLEHLLTQEVDQVINAAKAEAQNPKARTTQSLFAPSTLRHPPPIRNYEL